MSTVFGGAVVLGGLFMVSQSAPVEKPRKMSMRALSLCAPLAPNEDELPK